MNRINKQMNDKYQQLLEIFSNYLNDYVFVINSLKKSLYDILNISLQPTQTFIQPSLPSVTANCKKTLDDLKRISSILRGYSRSKTSQRQDDELRKSKIKSIVGYSRQRQFRSASQHFSRISKQKQNAELQKIDMVTFELPNSYVRQKQVDQIINQSSLRHHHSLRNFHKNEDSQKTKKILQQNTNISMEDQQTYYESTLYPDQKEITQDKKRKSKTLEKYLKNSIQQKIAQKEHQFKQSLHKHESGINQIIKINKQCVSIVQQIKKELKIKKLKKQKKQKQQKLNN